ncbi:MAG: TolC family protein, partial [Gammaproteobacteria bacterium]|nr:TolC family protein [Gammaproteobacteria bacterium]
MMMKIISLYLLSSLLFITPASAASKTSLTIFQVMQRVLDRYPSLKISEMEVAQAAQQRQQVESSLGWILNSSAGVKHDLTGLGTPSDRLDIKGSIGRKLKSGATLSLSGGYTYEDSTMAFSPSFPNPAHTTRLDLSYTLPLSQGVGNPQYIEGINSAEASYELTKANQLLTKITLAEKVKDLFYAALVTRARLANAEQAVERTRKLQNYINRNYKLGVSENKDKLQVKAQLDSTLAELRAIELQWKQQQTSLNRLMLENWDRALHPTLITNHSPESYNINKLIEKTRLYHPAVKISQAQLEMAESEITTARDSKKDNLDLVLSVGTRTSDGESTTGTVSEQDWAGAVSIQYKHLFDDSGVSSKFKQSLLKKSIALENIIKTNDDIRYTVSGLVTEIEAAKLAVDSAGQKLKSELLKLKEAEQRFRNGRADTAQLIQFQNEYSFAQLSYQ